MFYISTILRNHCTLPQRCLSYAVSITESKACLLCTCRKWPNQIRERLVLCASAVAQPASPNRLCTIKHGGAKLLDRSSAHVHCEKHGCNKLSKRVNIRTSVRGLMIYSAIKPADTTSASRFSISSWPKWWKCNFKNVKLFHHLFKQPWALLHWFFIIVSSN